MLRARTPATFARVGLALLAACAGCATPSGGPTEPAQLLRGDPVVVEALLPELTRRASALSSVRTMRATCVRTERVPGKEAPLVAQGRLDVRRTPPTLLFAVTGGQQVREDRETRLVLDPLARRASRFRYERGNGRATIGVAALLLDLEQLFAAFELRSFERDPEGALTVQLAPVRGTEALQEAARLTLIFDDRQEAPREIRVTNEAGGTTSYRIVRPTYGTPDPADSSAFRLSVPEGFTEFVLSQG